MSEEKKKEVLDQEKELDAEELDAVSGGDKCSCGATGGGDVGILDDPCICVVGGVGAYNDLGELIHGDKCRCACMMGGDGDGS